MLDIAPLLLHPTSMPRTLRVEYPGAIYYVIHRGDRREDIFVKIFSKTVAEASYKTDWEVHAYCLMRNHFHLVVETANATLVAGMQGVLSAYAKVRVRSDRRNASWSWKPATPTSLSGMARSRSTYTRCLSNHGYISDVTGLRVQASHRTLSTFSLLPPCCAPSAF
jgi:REP element-mobilizing transposase RayT